MTLLGMVRSDTPAPTVRLRGAGFTDVGRERDKNEDTLWTDPDLEAFLVCDGMGGHDDGEIAASLASETIEAVLGEHRSTLDKARGGKRPSSVVVDIVREAFSRANSAIREASGPRRLSTLERPMGTTATLAVRSGASRVTLAHLGDTRLYLIRAGEAHQLTVDHTVAAMLVAANVMSPEEAALSPFANSLDRGLGLAPAVIPDTLTVDVIAGDTLVLCSDGLARYIEGDELVDHLTGDPETSAAALVSFANQAGGADNISVFVIAVDPQWSAMSSRDHELVKLEALRATWLGRGLRLRDLQRLANCATVRRLDAGTEIIGQWSPGDCWFRVLSGAVATTSSTGTELIGPDGDAGVGFLVSERHSNATFTTRGPTEILAIGGEPFRELCARRPALGVELLLRVARQLDAVAVRLGFAERDGANG